MSDDSETLLEFPCRFAIKAMGHAAPDFESLIVEIVRRHAPDLDTSDVRLKHSKGGNWLSVTVEIEATSKLQLDAIYRDLTANERVVWAL